MITISAFADEIDQDLDVQMRTCLANSIRCIDVRTIDGKGIVEFTPAEARQYKKRLDERGFSVPCIGSPIGRTGTDKDFQSYLDLVKHCCEIAKVFGTNYIRVLSFYGTEGKSLLDQRVAVMERIAAMVKVAEASNLVFLIENKPNTYGARPNQIKDIFATIKSKHLKGLFDPAGFVLAGVAPYDEAWKAGLDTHTAYFHATDAKGGRTKACVPVGTGKGQFKKILADLKARDWSGYMTLELNLSGRKVSGGADPKRFRVAVTALKKLCDEVGIEYN